MNTKHPGANNFSCEKKKLVSNLGQGVTSQCNQAWLSLITTCTGNRARERKQKRRRRLGRFSTCPLASVRSNNFKVRWGSTRRCRAIKSLSHRGMRLDLVRGTPFSWREEDVLDNRLAKDTKMILICNFSADTFEFYLGVHSYSIPKQQDVTFSVERTQYLRCASENI